MLKKTAFFFLFYLLNAVLFAQADSNTVIRFDFNDHQVKEVNDQLVIKPVGVILVDDRFGNDRSAVFMLGHATSYINFGSSDLLKARKTTISMWVNLQTGVLAGKGYSGNPFMIIKNSPGEDFIIAYGLGYSPFHKRVGCQSTRDSLREVAIYSTDTVSLNKWYHLVMASDDHNFSFYLNGELQGRVIKDFETKFCAGDSVVLGRSTGPKNERYCHAIFDDIRIFHRVLSEKEILALYNEPNPNRTRNILFEFAKYGGILLVFGLIIMIMIIRNRKNLQRQKQYYEMNNKVTELELKVIRTQMNPHFISNCLAAIQNLIYRNEIEKAAQYLARFNTFLREVLDYSDKTYITLQEEIETIQLNVELEQLRFSDNFTFQLDIDDGPDLKHILIPTLITQPFIENAIWHGLMPLKNRSPRLLVRVFMEDNFVYVVIEDNGVGRQSKSAVAGKSSHGMRLAADKIESMNRLSNSSDYTFEVKDLFDETGAATGTRVSIRLSHYRTEE